jgi:antiphage defense system Thoeris ThsB-like protein
MSLLRGRPKNRAFLSFIEEDKPHVHGLRLLAANPAYELEFYDESVRVAIDGRDADYIKRKIREKISRTSVTVSLISAQTHTSAWVDWELEESDAKGNTVIAQRQLPFHGCDPALLNRRIAEA